jgi:hypothetical protein
VRTLICRWCKGTNVKALGSNVQCFDCGRLSETITYAPRVEPDQTPEEAVEAAALAAEIEAEEQARDEAAAAPLAPGSVSRAKQRKR